MHARVRIQLLMGTMKALLWIVASIACCAALPNGFVTAEDLAVAAESFPYRGTYPMELEFLGPPGTGWKSSWRRWGDLPPVFIDSHTINNPFGGGHGSTERASNHSGQYPLFSPGYRIRRDVGSGAT